MVTVNGINIKTGDVLLKSDHGSVTHRAIRFGQWLGANAHGNAKIVHAAIYVGSVPGHRHAIAESVGSGVRFIVPNPASTYRWHVWHLNGQQELRHLAADIAANLVIRPTNQPGFGVYSQASAFMSAFSNATGATIQTGSDILERIDDGRISSVFCSNFVVLVYSLACEILNLNKATFLNLDYLTASPSAMQTALGLNPHWTQVGVSAGLY